jgi:sugar (pentulose or hexulose) kinase
MYLGIDFGTSGARACVIAPGGQIEEMARLDYGAPGHLLDQIGRAHV